MQARTIPAIAAPESFFRCEDDKEDKDVDGDDEDVLQGERGKPHRSAFPMKELSWNLLNVD